MLPLASLFSSTERQAVVRGLQSRLGAWSRRSCTTAPETTTHAEEIVIYGGPGSTPIFAGAWRVVGTIVALPIISYSAYQAGKRYNEPYYKYPAYALSLCAGFLTFAAIGAWRTLSNQMVLKMTLHVPKNLLSVERKHAFFVGRTYKTKFSPSDVSADVKKLDRPDRGVFYRVGVQTRQGLQRLLFFEGNITNKELFEKITSGAYKSGSSVPPPA